MYASAAAVHTGSTPDSPELMNASMAVRTLLEPLVEPRKPLAPAVQAALSAEPRLALAMNALAASSAALSGP